MGAPTNSDRELAREIVVLVLRDQEAAWEAVSQLIADGRSTHERRREMATLELHASCHNLTAQQAQRLTELRREFKR